MNSLPEDGNVREGGPVSGPFAKPEILRVVHGSCLPPSADAASNVPSGESCVVEASFGPNGNFESTVLCGNLHVYCVYETLEGVSDLSERPNDVRHLLWISIPRNAHEVCARCFYHCQNLVGVTFGASSKVERICAEVFCGTSIASLSIPDSVIELGERCFCGCRSLQCVTFGASSKLERICAEAFYGTEIESLSIPDSVIELGEKCCCECVNLHSVTFSVSSKLERVCARAFCQSNVVSLFIPDSVVELGDGCFFMAHLRKITFGASSMLKRICDSAFGINSIESLCIPDSVIELGPSCFSCRNLRSVTFGASSKIEQIANCCFSDSALESFDIPQSLVKLGGAVFCNCPLRCEDVCCEHCSFVAVGNILLSEDSSVCHCLIGRVRDIVIPDSVVEICESCFQECTTLQRVTFGAESTLERIGAQAFCGVMNLESLSIPDSVVELGKACFSGCIKLKNVTFGAASTLARIGAGAFTGTKVESLSIRDGVVVELSAGYWSDDMTFL